MAIRLTPAHDPSKQVDFELPLEDGKVLEFSVRKFKYFPKDVQRQYDSWFQEIEGKVKSKKLTLRETDFVLKALELVAPDAYPTLCELEDGVLLEIAREWERQSDVSLGESEPSPGS